MNLFERLMSGKIGVEIEEPGKHPGETIFVNLIELCKSEVEKDFEGAESTALTFIPDLKAHAFQSRVRERLKLIEQEIQDAYKNHALEEPWASPYLHVPRQPKCGRFRILT